MRVDLHIHTTASDGTWTPRELVREALRANLGAIAVTDHDSVENVAETAILAREAGLGFLPAAEVNATKAGKNMHILGYGIDVGNRVLLELMRHNERLLEVKDEETIMLLERDGWPVSIKEFASYSYDRRRGGWRALAYLIDKGLCKDVGDFFQRIFTPEHDLGFPAFPSIKEVVAVIHGAGGAAICAHAASDFYETNLIEAMEMLSTESLDGFECYHSLHSEEGTRFLLEHCQKNNLLISGGSDCHGAFIGTRKLGNPQVRVRDLHLPGLL